MSENDSRARWVLDTMRKQAEELGVTGVCVFVEAIQGLSRLTIEVEVVGRMHRAPDMSRGEDDQGTNYLAVALSKMATMMRTGMPSGDEGLQLFGEHGYQGGLLILDEHGSVHFAFSGATAEQDLLVSNAGRIAYQEYMTS